MYSSFFVGSLFQKLMSIVIIQVKFEIVFISVLCNTPIF